MSTQMETLRDLIIALDLNDRNLKRLSADEYRVAAVKTYGPLLAECAAVPMIDFTKGVDALQTIAENVFFENRGFFADLDDACLATRAKEIAESLFARLHCPLTASQPTH